MHSLIYYLVRCIELTCRKHSKPKVKESPIQSHVAPFTWNIDLDMSSIKYQLALDAGYIVLSSEHGIAHMQGDMIAAIEYDNYCAAHKKDIQREFMARYGSNP